MSPFVIVVDDEIEIIESILEGFEDEDFEVKAFSSFSDAHNFITSLAQDAPLKAIITDQHIKAPVGGGVGNELLDTVSLLFPNARRAILSGADDLDLTLQALNNNLVDKYIPKGGRSIYLSIAEFLHDSMKSNIVPPDHARRYQGLVKNRVDMFADYFPNMEEQYRVEANHLIKEYDASLVDPLLINRWFESESERQFRSHVKLVAQMGSILSPPDTSISHNINNSLFHTLSLDMDDWGFAVQSFRDRMIHSAQM